MTEQVPDDNSERRTAALGLVLVTCGSLIFFVTPLLTELTTTDWIENFLIPLGGTITIFVGKLLAFTHAERRGAGSKLKTSLNMDVVTALAVLIAGATDSNWDLSAVNGLASLAVTLFSFLSLYYFSDYLMLLFQSLESSQLEKRARLLKKLLLYGAGCIALFALVTAFAGGRFGLVGLLGLALFLGALMSQNGVLAMLVLCCVTLWKIFFLILCFFGFGLVFSEKSSEMVTQPQVPQLNQSRLAVSASFLLPILYLVGIGWFFIKDPLFTMSKVSIVFMIALVAFAMLATLCFTYLSKVEYLGLLITEMVLADVGLLALAFLYLYYSSASYSYMHMSDFKERTLLFLAAFMLTSLLTFANFIDQSLALLKRGYGHFGFRLTLFLLVFFGSPLMTGKGVYLILFGLAIWLLAAGGALYSVVGQLTSIIEKSTKTAAE
jgi:hypothetical protein